MITPLPVLTHVLAPNPIILRIETIEKQIAADKQAKLDAIKAQEAAAQALATQQAQLLAQQQQKVVTSPPAAPGGCVVGYTTGDYYLDKIIAYESGGRSCVTNPGGCFGLLQACPGEPLRLACGGDPSCQIAWFQQNKTGGRSWAEVWQHELDWGWW